MISNNELEEFKKEFVRKKDVLILLDVILRLVHAHPKLDYETDMGKILLNLKEELK